MDTIIEIYNDPKVKFALKDIERNSCTIETLITLLEIVQHTNKYDLYIVSRLSKIIPNFNRLMIGGLTTFMRGKIDLANEVIQKINQKD